MLFQGWVSYLDDVTSGQSIMAQQKFEWANIVYNLHSKTPNDDELSTSKPIRTSWLTGAEKWLYQHIFSLYSICQTAFHKKLLGWTQEFIFSLLQSMKFKSGIFARATLHRCSHIWLLGVRWSLIKLQPKAAAAVCHQCYILLISSHTMSHLCEKLSKPPPQSLCGLLKALRTVAVLPRTEVYLHLNTEAWPYSILLHFSHHSCSKRLLTAHRH